MLNRHEGKGKACRRRNAKNMMNGLVKRLEDTCIVENANRLRNLNKSGVPSAQHQKVLSSAKRLAWGVGSVKGAELDQRIKRLERDTKLLNDRGFHLVEPEVKLAA